MRKSVVIDAKRSPIGSFLGCLSHLSAIQLGEQVLRNILQNPNLNKNQIDEIIIGNVLSAGLGQAPARQIALSSGLPYSIDALTINKMCGSSLKSVMLADQVIRCGTSNMVIAGGVESMSNAPFLLRNYREGRKFGHSQMIDSMIIDGLWDVYNDIHMGECAEKCASDFHFTREELDVYSKGSYEHSLKAIDLGKFKEEIVPIRTKMDLEISVDEEPKRVKYEKIPKLKPAFTENGIVTAANASKLSDGASMLLIGDYEYSRQLKLNALVEIVDYVSYSANPIDFPTAPAYAIKKLLDKNKMTIDDIDLFEVNEAFSVVVLAVLDILNLDIDKVNVNGGAISIGHPIGASGARILTTLIYELKRRNVEYGIASICIGGGEASAVLIKNLNN